MSTPRYFGNTDLPDGEEIELIETQQIKPGVTCDVIEAVDSEDYDFSRVLIEPGCYTDKQMRVSGEKIITGQIRGRGTLCIWKPDINQMVAYPFNEENGCDLHIPIQLGWVIQWFASIEGNGPLEIWDQSFPPFKDCFYISMTDTEFSSFWKSSPQTHP